MTALNQNIPEGWVLSEDQDIPEGWVLSEDQGHAALGDLSRFAIGEEAGAPFGKPTANRPDVLAKARNAIEKQGVGDAVASGLFNSSLGRILSPGAEVPFNPSGTASRIAHDAATMIADVPAMIGGAASGSPLGPIGAAAGAFAAPTAIKETYRNIYDKPEAKSFDDTLGKLADSAVEVGKAAIVGGLTGGAGLLAGKAATRYLAGAKPTATASPEAALAYKEAVKGAGKKIAAAEAAAAIPVMVESGSILHNGKVINPIDEPEAFLEAAGQIALLHGAVKGGNALARMVDEAKTRLASKLEERRQAKQGERIKQTIAGELERKSEGGLPAESRDKNVPHETIDPETGEVLPADARIGEKTMRESPEAEAASRAEDARKDFQGSEPRDFTNDEFFNKMASYIEEPVSSPTVVEKADTGQGKPPVVARDFIKNPRTGKFDFGEIAPDIVREAKEQSGAILEPAPIRLLPKDAEHVWERRGNKLIDLGYASPEEFVADVVNGFTEIRKSVGDTLLLSKGNGDIHAAYVELKKAEDGNFYKVNSAFVARPDRISMHKRELVWRRSEPSLSDPGSDAHLRPPGTPLRTTSSNKPGRNDPNVKGQINSESNIEPSAGEIKSDSLNNDRVGAKATSVKSVKRLKIEKQIADNEALISSLEGRKSGEDPRERKKADKKTAKIKEKNDVLKQLLGKIRDETGSTDLFTREPEPRALAKKAASEAGGGAAFSQERLDINKAANDYRNAFATKVAKKISLFDETFTDQSAGVKAALRKLGDLGEKASRNFTLIGGAAEKGERAYDTAYKTVLSGLTRKEKSLLNDFILIKRVEAIDQEVARKKAAGTLQPEDDVAHPFGLTGQDAAAWLRAMRKGLPPELANKMDERSDAFANVFRSGLTRMLEKGLIDKASFDNLSKAAFYSPRRFLEFIDPLVRDPNTGKVDVRSSGVKNIKGGGFGAVESDANAMLVDFFRRLEGRIAFNDANLALLKIAEKDPENGIVQLIDSNAKSKGGDADSIITAMRGGKPVEMLMDTRLAKEWITPESPESIAGLMGILSGIDVLKWTATGANPYFALGNVARDWGHLYMVNQRSYSKHLPIYLTQIIRDSALVIGDVADGLTGGHVSKAYKDFVGRESAPRQNLYELYIDSGGGMDSITMQGSLFDTHTANHSYRMINKTLGFLGVLSEMTTRVAHFRRILENKGVLKDGADMDLSDAKTREALLDAAAQAREVMDFHVAGKAVREANQFIPYLSASVRGAYRNVEFAKENAALWGYRAANIFGAAVGLTAYNMLLNPDGHDKTSSYDKAANATVQLPKGFWQEKDKDGVFRDGFFKIPLDQSSRVVWTIGRMLTEKVIDHAMYEGKRTPDWDSAMAALQAAVPVGVDMPFAPPTVGGLAAALFNVDTYRGNQIWDRQGVEARGRIKRHMEYDDSTNPLLVEFARELYDKAKIDVSPKRFEVLMGKYLAKDSPLPQLAGYLSRTPFEKLPGEARKTIVEKMKQSGGEGWSGGFKKKFMGYTEAETVQSRQENKETDIDVNSRNLAAKREFQKLLQDYEKTEDPSDILDYIADQPYEKRETLRRKFKDARKLYDIGDFPHKALFMDLLHESAEARAVNFYRAWDKETPENQIEMEDAARRIPGFNTSEFKRKFRQLQNGEEE